MTTIQSTSLESTNRALLLKVDGIFQSASLTWYLRTSPAIVLQYLHECDWNQIPKLVLFSMIGGWMTGTWWVKNKYTNDFKYVVIYETMRLMS